MLSCRSESSKYKLGCLELSADALSRRSMLHAALYKLPASVHNDDDDEDFLDNMKARVDAIEAGVHAVMRINKINVITRDSLYEATQEEPLMFKLFEVVLRGFSQSSYNLEEDLRPYHRYRQLHIADGVVCKDRAVILTRLRPQLLQTIHGAHQGGSGMISRVENR